MFLKNLKPLYYSIFLLILIMLFTGSSQTRCSKFGIILLDNIFGLDGVGIKCYDQGLQIRPDKVKKNPDKKRPNVKYYYDTSNKIKKECPINSNVIVIIGQSNAGNSVISKVLQDKNNLNYNPNDNFCYELSEPVLGAEGNLDSITSSIGKKLIAKKPILFINRSVSGSRINQWAEFFAEDLNRILKKVLEKNVLNSIVWIHGEGENINTSKEYFKNFKIMNELIFKDLKIKFEDTNFIITHSTYCKPWNLDEEKENKKELDLQRKLISEKWSNIKLLEITDNLNASYRYDQCHFNRKGTEIISDVISKSINLTLQNN